MHHEPPLNSIFPRRFSSSSCLESQSEAALEVRVPVSSTRPSSDLNPYAVDIRDIAPVLLDAILSKIESAGSAEEVAKNGHLMKMYKQRAVISTMIAVLIIVVLVILYVKLWWYR
ncbi:hypothetical protein FIBSPDRAFT_926111 [Athelia psychrophila]|uniref:Uncharacterized protein n=1 Tax=Athelia psychrophila TaxID=1759441 RepID=A0A166TUY9_9AGAM|nr:hypothetical protein FIBSPDRAFT_926111 [Fibularhizoctonia sp. CBS 109695]